MQNRVAYHHLYKAVSSIEFWMRDHFIEAWRGLGTVQIQRELEVSDLVQRLCIKCGTVRSYSTSLIHPEDEKYAPQDLQVEQERRDLRNSQEMVEFELKLMTMGMYEWDLSNPLKPVSDSVLKKHHHF